MCHNTLMKHAIKPLPGCNTAFFMQQNSMHQNAEEALRARGRAFMGVRYGLFRMTGKAFSRHRGDRKRVKKVFYS